MPQLPPASILQKLKAHNPYAPQIIMALAEYNQRERDKSALNRHFNKEAFLGSFISVITLEALFNPSKTRKRMNTIRQNSASQAWMQVGNDLRQAIRTYMDEKKITPEDIGLTPSEQNNLFGDRLTIS